MLKDITGALKDMDKALYYNPKNPEYYYTRAVIKTEHKNYKSAILDLNKAISINPKEGKYYCSRGLLKMQIGELQVGCEDIKQAIKLGDVLSENYQKQYCK
jgi:tetratricopeptide (TPR) repeat protein